MLCARVGNSRGSEDDYVAGLGSVCVHWAESAVGVAGRMWWGEGRGKEKGLTLRRTVLPMLIRGGR